MKRTIWIAGLATLLLSACPADQQTDTDPSPSPEAPAFTALPSATVSPAAWKVPASGAPGNLKANPPASQDIVAFGESLIRNTALYLGPEVTQPAKRIAGNHLSCSNCHLQAGQAPDAIGFVGVSKRYPQYQGRENRIVSLSERINGCFERSLNGRSLPEYSREMQVMLAYLDWLSKDSPEGGQHEHQDLPEIDLLDRAADPKLGQVIYQQRCQSCHQDKGQGLLKNVNVLAEGYLYPPLWGDDSFNDGAGMHRLITAAQFIKANMPQGQANLSTAEAFDVAAFINSKPRPHLAKREKDYPDISKKPVDAPYPPFADQYPLAQHQLGPFGPMQ